MNSVYLLIAAACFFALAYRFYSVFICSKILLLNDNYNPEFDTCKRKKCLEPLKLKVSRHFVFF